MKTYLFISSRIYDMPMPPEEIDWLLRVELYESAMQKHHYLARIMRRDRFSISNALKKVLWVEDFFTWDPDNRINADNPEEAFEAVEHAINYRMYSEPIPAHINARIMYDASSTYMNPDKPKKDTENSEQG